jgi:hypothetical protein
MTGLSSSDKYYLCTLCENFRESTKTCKICGCFMPLKTLIPIFDCPQGRWTLELDTGDAEE